jgi:methionyl-tRNA formyltransferase
VSRSALRVAFFGSAARFSALALEALAARHRVTIAITAEPFWRRLRRSIARAAGLRPASPLREIARRFGIPVAFASNTSDGSLEDALRRHQPDLICIAIYPKLLGPSTLGIAPLGAINAHASLLPRHRGPLPIFWTYFTDDREAGVTIHHANERFDCGDIILQERKVLPRCYPAAQLDMDLAGSAAQLLAEAVERIAARDAPRSRQIEADATQAPRISDGTRMVRFDEWDSERVWHFLGGLAPRYREPLADERGRPVLYDTVPGYQTARSSHPAGTIETVADGWKLYCRDGIVMLSSAKTGS